MNLPNINIFFARVLIDYLINRGVNFVCLSPGSRSTPLVVAAATHPDLKIKVINDERASGYYATGFARASGRPTAVISTSGTAAANFYPSVIEACHARLPVIYITADRPTELQDLGANQTINQFNLFGTFARSLTLEAPNNDTDPAEVLDNLAELLKDLDQPIHINCRFREPLAPVEADFDISHLQKKADAWRERRQPAKQIPPVLSNKEIVELARTIGKYKRGIIIAGPEQPFQTIADITRLADKLDWPVFADILSQQKFSSHPDTCRRYDLYIEAPRLIPALKPDVVLHFGGLPTSKRFNRFLVDCRISEYFKIQNHHHTIDPDHLETGRIIADPALFIQNLLPLVKQSSGTSYRDQWMKCEEACRDFLTGNFNSLTEPALAWRLGQLLPDGEALFLSSSMPVREADTFMASGGRDVIVGANRGASGIDGVMASACGFATGCRRPTTIVIGDLALLHDMNSMKIAAASKYPLRIIVFNNNGGGIFQHLPIAGFKDIFEDYFVTPINMNFKHSADQFGLEYFAPKSLSEFNIAYGSLAKSKNSGLIEVMTDRKINFEEHSRIRSTIRSDIDK